jgi:hypothetical protein
MAIPTPSCPELGVSKELNISGSEIPLVLALSSLRPIHDHRLVVVVVVRGRESAGRPSRALYIYVLQPRLCVRRREQYSVAVDSFVVVIVCIVAAQRSSKVDLEDRFNGSSHSWCIERDSPISEIYRALA